MYYIITCCIDDVYFFKLLFVANKLHPTALEYLWMKENLTMISFMGRGGGEFFPFPRFPTLDPSPFLGLKLY